MNKLKCIIKGLVISNIVSLFFLFIISILLLNTNFKEQYIEGTIIIFSAISILIGTSIATIKINKYGIINGIIISILYMLILYISSSFICNDFSVSISTIFMLIFGIILGTLGGIIGVNIKY